MAILRHVDFEYGHKDGMLVNIYNHNTNSYLYGAHNGSPPNDTIIVEPISGVPIYDINISGITGNWIVDIFVSGIRNATLYASDSHLFTEDSPPWLQGSGSINLDAAGVRSAIGLNSANLNTQLVNISGEIIKVPRLGSTYKHYNTGNATEATVEIQNP